MKAYILKIIGAALIATFSEYIVPEGWQKYMKLISGFIIISVLLSPFTVKTPTEIFDNFEIESHQTKAGEELMYKNLKTQLEQTVADDIKLRAIEEFSSTLDARVSIKTDKEGKIEQVEKIELKGEENQAITERFKYVYGTDEVIWIE